MGKDEDRQCTTAETEVSPGADQFEQVESPAWVVAKSLLDVERTCANTMEEFLLYATTDRVEELPATELETRIDELIVKQERAIAELELAKRALTDLDSD